MLTSGLATFYLAFSATRLHGPLGLFERARRAVLTERGYVDQTGQGDYYRRPVGGGQLQPIEADWLASGVTCPVCASLYVAPIVLALGRSERGRRIVGALAVAGLASALYRVGDRP